MLYPTLSLPVEIKFSLVKKTQVYFVCGFHVLTLMITGPHHC